MTPSTLKNTLNRYHNHVKPLFGEMQARSILAPQCQLLIDRLGEEGKGKTADEIFSLLNAISSCLPWRSTRGMRPNEYYSAKIEGDFIVTVNSKRKNGKVEYKKIPIISLLRPYLEGVTELKFYGSNRLRERFRTFSKIIRFTTFGQRSIRAAVNAMSRMRRGQSLSDIRSASSPMRTQTSRMSAYFKEGEKLNYY